MNPTPLRHPLLILAIGLIVLPWPVIVAGYTWGTATEIAIFVVVGLGFNLLLGYTGLLSFGHGLFFGLAAYCTALTQIHWFPDSIAAAVRLRRRASRMLLGARWSASWRCGGAAFTSRC